MNAFPGTTSFDPKKSSCPLIVYLDLKSPYAYMDARRYARMRGLTLRATVKIWDTTLAGIGMLWAKEQGEAVLARYLDRSFEGFWKRELDAESPFVIESLLRKCGADVSGFTAHAESARSGYLAEQMAIFDAGIFGVPGFREYGAGDGPRDLEATTQQLSAEGVWNVPAYLVGSELFIGRQHLPIVERLATENRKLASV